MKKKTLLIVLTLATILCISTISFANNEIKNDISNAVNTTVDGAERLGNDVKNGIESTTDTIEDGAKNLGNAISGGMQKMENSISNGFQDMTDTNNSDYTATRTTASDLTDTNTMTSNMWIWIAKKQRIIKIVKLDIKIIMNQKN